MTPKKRARKGDGSSSSNTFDPSQFISQEASEKYAKLDKLRFIKERGFAKPNRVLQREVVIKGWTELCKHFKAVVAPIVCEFYANLCGE